MPKPTLQLMIGDKELRAIGHVAAQWAYLETQLDLVLEIFIHQPSTKHLGIKSGQSFKRRMDALRKTVKIVLAAYPTELKEVVAIATDASSLRGFRDDIVHGHWKLHREKGRGLLTTGIMAFGRNPTFKVRKMAFTAAKAEGIAAKISATHLQLIEWCMRNIPQR